MLEDLWHVKTYADDIHKHLRFKEGRRFMYRYNSPQLRDRKSLVEWMDKVCDHMEFSTTVQHLAVYLMDVFMDNHMINSEHLHMVTLGCLIVAVKLEEKDELVPKNTEWNALLGNRYKLAEFVQMEVAVLSYFDWDVFFPTAAHFAEYYALYAVSRNDCHGHKPISNYDVVAVYVQKYIDYFLEVTLQDYHYLDFQPSLVAASCIAATRNCLVLTPPWPVNLQKITYYTYAQLKCCMGMLLRALDADMIASRKGSETSVKESSKKSSEATDCMLTS